MSYPLRSPGPKVIILALFVLGVAVMACTSSPERAAVHPADVPPSVVALPAAAPIQPSPARVIEASFPSTRLSRDMPLLVYLPPGYDSSINARFPVLYMLHGLGGSYRTWQDWGLFAAATRLIDAGAIAPMIIVTPEGGRGYWVNHYNNGPRYGGYITKGLVAYIDANYSTLPASLFRGIGGMSMGGHGALQLAFNNPSEFTVVGAHSVALRTKEQAFEFFGDQDYFESHDPVSIITKHRKAATSLALWMDIGSGDPWYNAASGLHELLQREGVKHTWRVWEGGHDAAYASSHVDDYLRFYAGAFAINLARSHLDDYLHFDGGAPAINRDSFVNP